ncbi:MAG: aspartyl/asparaginyl beta-hydroxylase domain-containing protein [Bacteroidia bacterium]|jgi:hypothetical protein|nr:aspartyl/asparaginyl beta-hydroxylase domain-containing protein [Bacteroidia bacterium]
MESIWYSYSGQKYGGGLPAYTDPHEFAWAVWAEENFARIRSDVENWLNAHGHTLKPYFYGTLVSRPDAWKVEPFYNWGRRNEALCKSIPALDELFGRIPGLTSAAISKLEPGTDIHAHYGDTNAIVRCHFGLQIPGELPDCGLEVNGKQRAWEEGRWLMFCDAHLHRAWNRTPHARYVLIVDVMRPEFEKSKAEICANVLSMHALQALEQKYPVVKKLPGKLRGIIRRMLKRKSAAR